MIPISLRLRNFLSYGDEEHVLDFRRFRTACLCGSNGEGKSALLDAITWALWGIARGVEGPEEDGDDLIRAVPSAEEACVEFEFATEQGQYRVTRTLRRGGHQRVALEMLEDDACRPVEGDGGDRQGAIIRAVGLDYRGFVSSSFVLQGRADEFARQSPAERRRTLADLLGLGRYAELERRADGRARAADSSPRLRRGEAARIREQVADEPRCREALESARADSEASAAEAARCEQALRRARAGLDDLRARAQARSAVHERLDVLRAEQRELDQQAATFRARVGEHDAIIAQADEIRDGYRRLLEARDRERQQAQLAGDAARLTERRRALESEMDARRLRLEVEASALSEQERQLAAEVVPPTSVTGELQQVAAQREELIKLVEVLERRRSEQQRQEGEVARLRERQAALSAEMEALTRRLSLLADAEARCPICRKPLDADDRDRLVGEIRTQEGEKRKALRAVERDLARAAGKAESAASETAEVERRLGALGEVEERLGALRRRAEEYDQKKDQLETLRAALAKARERLARGDYAAEARTQLAAVCADLDRLGYDRPAQEAAAALAAELAPFEQRHAQLEAAEQALAADRGALEGIERTLAARSEEMSRLSQQAERADAAADRLAEAQRRAEEAERSLDAAREGAARAAADTAAAEERLATFDPMRERLAACEREAAAFEEESALYSELARAFGPGGIQADLIGIATAEITREANDILARITDGRMGVALDPDHGERVAIRVSDELGTRRYELLSRGEAFRIDFAIRLGLSRVVARRAGAPLRLLVIDEGFGTQDAQGRRHLVRALRAVEPDFEKVLVVTHFEPLRDAFQHQIEVTKDEHGSHFVQIGG